MPERRNVPAVAAGEETGPLMMHLVLKHPLMTQKLMTQKLMARKCAIGTPLRRYGELIGRASAGLIIVGTAGFALMAMMLELR